MASKDTTKNEGEEPEITPNPPQTSVSYRLPGEWLVCAVLLVLSAGFLVGSFEYAEAVRRWPLILSSTVIILIVAYALYRLWTGTFMQSADLSKETESTEAEPVNDRAIVATAVSFVLFAILAYGVGFLLASIIFIGGYMVVSGHRSFITITGVVLGFSVAIYLLFGVTLNAPLNEGAWLYYSLEWLPV